VNSIGSPSWKILLGNYLGRISWETLLKHYLANYIVELFREKSEISWETIEGDPLGLFLGSSPDKLSWKTPFEHSLRKLSWETLFGNSLGQILGKFPWGTLLEHYLGGTSLG